MGTALTGTEIKDTYDSLIKITDNGPISGTLKALSDGLGNDSALSLSTGAASVTGTLAVSSTTTLAAGLVFSASDFVIGANTSDGSDNKASYLCGGETQSTARGANIRVYGNEYTDQNGDLIMYSGNVANSEIQLRAQSSTSQILMYTNDAERMRITSAGKVGINTTSALGQLNIRNESAGATTNALALYNTPSNTQNTGVAIEFYPNVGVDDRCARISSVNPTTTGTNLSDLRFFTSDNAAPTEKLRITHTGNVGIGTDSPASKLSVSDGTNSFYVSHDASGPYLSAANNPNTVYKRLSYDASEHLFFASAVERVRVDSDGLKFNGDTAAANALDDYEEGTWTPIYEGGSTAGTYTASSEAYYTKIGRQVTVYWYSTFSVASGGSGYLLIGGLPYSYRNGSAGSIGSVSSTYLTYTADTIYAQVTTGSSGNTLLLAETASGADVTLVQVTDVSTSTTLRVSMTYFV